MRGENDGCLCVQKRFNRVECVCNLGDKNDLAYESDLNIRFKRRRRFCDLVINRSEIEMWSLFPILKFFPFRYIVLSISLSAFNTDISMNLVIVISLFFCSKFAILSYNPLMVRLGLLLDLIHSHTHVSPNSPSLIKPM